MSTGKLPSSHCLHFYSIYRGMERDEEIGKIKARMKELGLNQRSLALRAGCKPDIVRNRLSGKSRNWRQDTHKAIMKVLWPDDHKNNDPSSLNEIEKGLLASFQIVFAVLTWRGLVTENDLSNLISQQIKNLAVENLPGAIEVMERLKYSLGLKISEPVIPNLRKILPSLHGKP